MFDSYLPCRIPTLPACQSVPCSQQRYGFNLSQLQSNCISNKRAKFLFLSNGKHLAINLASRERKRKGKKKTESIRLRKITQQERINISFFFYLGQINGALSVLLHPTQDNPNNKSGSIFSTTAMGSSKNKKKAVSNGNLLLELLMELSFYRKEERRRKEQHRYQSRG